MRKTHGVMLGIGALPRPDSRLRLSLAKGLPQPLCADRVASSVAHLKLLGKFRGNFPQFKMCQATRVLAGWPLVFFLRYLFIFLDAFPHAFEEIFSVLEGIANFEGEFVLEGETQALKLHLDVMIVAEDFA